MSFELEFRHLSYFVAVAEEGSFMKAASRLHVTQPTLTRQIKQVEEALDASLLFRESFGTRLSPAGNALLPLAKQLLQLREDAAEKASAVHNGRSSVFRFGYSPFVSQGLLREALDAYKDIVPNGAAEQSSEGSAALAKLVLTGKLDAALITLPVAGRKLLRQKICSERYLVCLRADDPHALKQTLTPDCVSANLRIFVDRRLNPSFSNYVERKLLAAGIHVRPKHIISTPADILFQVQAGQGWGLVHESLKLDSDLVRRKIEDVPIRVRTAFISRKNQELPLFPLLAFRLASSCQNRPTELRKALKAN